MAGVEGLGRGEKAVEGGVEVGVFEVVLLHEDEEAVVGVGG